MYETMKPEKRNLIIERILRVEWSMLQKVGGINGKAGCQEDWDTFHIMRYAYYNAWPNNLILSYIRDLDEAALSEKNLVMEKYAYMMEYTDPDYYATKLAPYLPQIDQETRALIEEISAYIVQCDKEFAAAYPRISMKGRPIEKNQDSTGFTSAESYAKGELRTYSKYTLRTLLDYVRSLKAEGKNLSYIVKQNMVQMYGYASLEDAERKM